MHMTTNSIRTMVKTKNFSIRKKRIFIYSFEITFSIIKKIKKIKKRGKKKRGGKIIKNIAFPPHPYPKKEELLKRRHDILWQQRILITFIVR